jgi:putative OPT family oligopeptide transporter
MNGIIAVLGVAAVVCVSSAVAGEMLQDLKVGHILGGTPWKMQTGNMFGILISSFVLFVPLMILHGAFTFGSKELSAPQAGLMAALAQGIVGGEMAWPLVVAGMFMGFVMILVQVRSPMLVAVGMYLPFETTFAIFCGGMIRGIIDKAALRRSFNPAQKARVENVGILIASGLIAGEALTALIRAALVFAKVKIPQILPESDYLYLGGIAALVVIGVYLILVPLRNAGAADEPAPPSAVI